RRIYHSGLSLGSLATASPTSSGAGPGPTSLDVCTGSLPVRGLGQLVAELCLEVGHVDVDHDGWLAEHPLASQRFGRLGVEGERVGDAARSNQCNGRHVILRGG